MGNQLKIQTQFLDAQEVPSLQPLDISFPKPLPEVIVVDIDETLGFVTSNPNNLVVEQVAYDEVSFFNIRPSAREFLQFCENRFEICYLWTGGEQSHAEKVAQIFGLSPNWKLLSRDHCRRTYDDVFKNIDSLGLKEKIWVVDDTLRRIEGTCAKIEIPNYWYSNSEKDKVVVDDCLLKVANYLRNSEHKDGKHELFEGRSGKTEKQEQ